MHHHTCWWYIHCPLKMSPFLPLRQTCESFFMEAKPYWLLTWSRSWPDAGWAHLMDWSPVLVPSLRPILKHPADKLGKVNSPHPSPLCQCRKQGTGPVGACDAFQSLFHKEFADLRICPIWPQQRWGWSWRPLAACSARPRGKTGAEVRAASKSFQN